MSQTRKVTVVGAGNVGASFAYALMQSGDAEEIVLTDASERFARGQALDLAQGAAFVPEVNVRVGTDADFADSDLIVVTAGAKQAPGETRIDLLRRNAALVSDLTRRIAASGSEGVDARREARLGWAERADPPLMVRTVLVAVAEASDGVDAVLPPARR